ncbi:cancer/testis antigen family 47 member C1 [Peromyscus maniculatus bairdii]|uniref:cancer/testis antigen family 47 member C1 n=1 Tax=Peromyscus maniculatus bairdii TaxID=230844 RepID=UPI001C2EB71F|nr:cancer/testis antigen 47A-like [Peromyscus maniculatus bairdii]
MSTTGNRDPTKESRDNPVTLEGEWVQEAAEGCRIGHESGLDGASATPAVEIMAVCPREVENVGLERNPEEEDDREESVAAEEGSDIDPVEKEARERGEENVENQDVVNTHQFPMAGFRFMFLDLIHAILNRVYYNNHVMIRRPSENQVRETPGPSASGHTSEVQVPPGTIPSTVRATECERRAPGLARSLPEVISTFPELEEPIDFEEEDYYLPEQDLCVQEPAVRVVAEEPAEQAIEVAAVVTAEDPAKEVMEQIMASEDECHCDIWNEEENIFEEEEVEKGEEKKNQGALEGNPDPAGSSTSKSS